MDAVIDGVKTTVTFKGDLPLMDTVENLVGDDGAMLKLSYDHDGYAVDASAIKNGDDYITLAQYASGVTSGTLDPEDVKMVANIGAAAGFKVDLSADGDTLWITNQTTMRGYALADNCPAVIVEWNEKGDKVDGVDEYSSVEKAIKNLDTYDYKTDKADFDGTIYLIFTDGIVSSVVMTDTVDDVEHTNPSDGVKYTAELVVGQDGKVTLCVSTKDGTPVSGKDVEYTYVMTSSSLISDFNTKDSGSSKIVNSSATDYVKFGTPNSMLSYQAVVEIDGEVLTTNVLFG